MTNQPPPLLQFSPLPSSVRKALESVVVEAREVVEAGIGKVFERLGVSSGGVSSRMPAHLSDDERLLRGVMLAKRRQVVSVEAAIEEVAFGVWHRMLFARFLAENGLLMHPEEGVAVSLGECAELAAEEGADGWVVASRFAAEMLPGLFPQDDLLAQIGLLPEDLAALEGLLEGLPREVFTSDDGLGWVYQFWQSRRKDEVNASEVKIGARELPAVTQLFTEHYMVRFLLENSLGAWWAARHPGSQLVEAFEYLRFTDDGQPAAGTFDGWPGRAAEVTVMDPCCGSGHFLTAAFEMLWRMRAEEEDLPAIEAQGRVIAENLFGLELDPRCTQIAAFNLALAAWKAGGYRQLPLPNIACCGIRVAGSLDEWRNLAGADPRLVDALEQLHAQFRDADTLGSLVDPRRASQDGNLLAVPFEELQPLLHKALARETATDPAAAVFGHQAEAVARAARLLSRTYTLITTNPPFLATGRMNERLRAFAGDRYPAAKHDLATVLMQKCFDWIQQEGTLAFVVPQGWLFLSRYEGLRRDYLTRSSWGVLANLGEGGFQSAAAAGAFVSLIVLSRVLPEIDHHFLVVDATSARGPDQKDKLIAGQNLRGVRQSVQLGHPDARVVAAALSSRAFLAELADSRYGLRTGDSARLIKKFWELDEIASRWRLHQSTVDETILFGGREHVLRWDHGSGALHELAAAGIASLQGHDAWGTEGVAVSLTRQLRSTLYEGTSFDNNCAVVWPHRPSDLPAIWAFCSSDVFNASVRAIDLSLKVTNATLLKVPFDVEHWSRVADEAYPNGLPEPHSDDPSQWLFRGWPVGSTDPLQVGVARLLGYAWPDQEPDRLDELADPDGIVCVPAVGGERPAAERLRELLVAAFEQHDPVGLVDGLLAGGDAGGKSLDWWLRERFFVQHCRLFQQRPFVWHIWDGRKDGFSALVNYHRLDNASLKKLTYSYLGWWINRQQGLVREGQAGAETRLAAALALQRELELTLEGEPPYDIFVRWKSLAEQPAGWEPDLDDGVRLNIRPFMEAGILRSRVGVNWNKDRGKNPDGTDRINSHHYTRAQKTTARQRHEAP